MSKWSEEFEKTYPNTRRIREDTEKKTKKKIKVKKVPLQLYFKSI